MSAFARSLDRVERLALVALAGLSVAVLAMLLTKGRTLTGADGLLATDQLQYLTWIREAAHHGLIGNRFDLAPGDRTFLHPGFLISGALHRIGVDLALSYLLWKPVAVGVMFTGALLFVRRHLPAGGARHAALILALFAVMPASPLVAWTDWGGNPRQYTFDFISGEMWSGQYLWGYLMTAIAVFAVPLVLLGLERWRREPSTRLLAACAAGSLLVMWLQPWQGATLALIVVATEAVAWRRDRDRSRIAGPLAVAAAALPPAAYYLALSRFDPAWERAGEANARGAQVEWSWPWWAIALVVAPLALPAALAYRERVLDWGAVALRVWPFAVLAVFLLPFGTFPYHAFQGLTLPLAVLTVQGIRAWRPQGFRPALVVGALFVMTVPGIAHKLEVSIHSIRSAGDPFWVFDGEREALEFIESDPRPGGVLSATYAGYMLPSQTGRESWIGPFSWTPGWKGRQRLADGLVVEGRLRGAAARRFVLLTAARWVFVDCRPGLRDLEADLRPILEDVRRFGCASVYVVRERPEMAQAAGLPDA